MTDAAHWYCRGYLPHFDQADVLIAATFCLADAIPEIRRVEFDHLLQTLEPGARFKAVETCLDEGYGERWLGKDRVAIMVQNALLFFHPNRYKLHEWVIMPTHVHALFERLEGWALEKVIHSWKSYTANKANRILHRTGQFWQEEVFDRFIRNEQHYRNAVEYICNNPVKAGLVKRPEDSIYSSAFLRANGWNG